MRELRIAILLFIVFLGVQLVAAGSVVANGKPIKVVLTYLPDVSNWGPANASGVAEVVMSEGVATIGVVGLPPSEQDVYHAWIVDTRSQQSLSVGTFNTEGSGIASREIVMSQEIPDKGWNLFLLTVEAKGEPASTPGPRRSIGGYFPDSVEGKQLPAQLPRTGGSAEPASTSPMAPASGTSAPGPKGRLPEAFDGLALGAVGLAAVAIGIMKRGKTRARSPKGDR